MKLQTKEKFSFLQLAHYLARIDKEYANKAIQEKPEMTNIIEILISQLRDKVS